MNAIAPEYVDFVRSRFKFIPDGLPPHLSEPVLFTSSASLMHAAIGLTGEAAELMVSGCRSNCMEELGDFEFFLCAAKIVTVYDETSVDLVEDISPACGEGPWGLHGLLRMAHEFQDHAKKEWAYSKPRSRPILHTLIWHMEEQLALLYEYLGLRRDDVLAANVGKLVKRFPNGYSDAAAQARADKAEDHE